MRSTILSIILASVVASACTSSSSTQPSATPTPATPTPTPTPVVKPALAAPIATAPPGGATVGSRPALTVLNAVRTGTITGAVSYTFEVSANSGFNGLAASGSSPEGSGQTTFTLTSDLTAGQTYFWRAVAVVAADALTSPPSDTQTMTIVNLTAAGKIAAQQGVVLWPGTQPTGTPGRARLGVGWGIGNQSSFDGVTFLSPPTDVLRVFDLIDRGFDPDAATRWLKANGYATDGVYYASVQAVGFPYQYMALIAGEWELVRRVGA